MTFKEKYLKENIGEVLNSICIPGCPEDYRYEGKSHCGNGGCKACWERIIPNSIPRKEELAGKMIELRNGKRYFVFGKGQTLNAINLEHGIAMEMYTDTLEHVNKNPEKTIVKVYNVLGALGFAEALATPGKLIWERPEKMTVKEIEEKFGVKLEDNVIILP